MNPKSNFMIAGKRPVIVLFLPALVVAGFFFPIAGWSQQDKTMTLQDISGTHSLVTHRFLLVEQGGILVYHKLRDEPLQLSWHMLDKSARQKVIDGQVEYNDRSLYGNSKSGKKSAKKTADSNIEALPISGLENAFAPLSKPVDKESALTSEGLVTIHNRTNRFVLIREGIVFAVRADRAYVFGVSELGFLFDKNGKPKAFEGELEIQWQSPEWKKASARWEYFDDKTNTFVASAPARDMPNVLKIAEPDPGLADKVRIIGYEITKLEPHASISDHAISRFDSFGTVTRITRKENSWRFDINLDNKNWGRVDRSLIFDSDGNAIGYFRNSGDMLPIEFPSIPD